MSDTPLTKEKGFTAIEMAIVIAIIAILMSIPLFQSITCRAKWVDSGMQSKWGMWSGCLVSKDGRRFIPDQRYREMADE